jgi:hypothetical protein
MRAPRYAFATFESSFSYRRRLQRRTRIATMRNGGPDIVTNWRQRRIIIRRSGPMSQARKNAQRAEPGDGHRQCARNHQCDGNARCKLQASSTSGGDLHTSPLLEDATDYRKTQPTVRPRRVRWYPAQKAVDRLTSDQPGDSQGALREYPEILQTDRVGIWQNHCAMIPIGAPSPRQDSTHRTKMLQLRRSAKPGPKDQLKFSQMVDSFARLADGQRSGGSCLQHCTERSDILWQLRLARSCPGGSCANACWPVRPMRCV